MQLDIKIQSNIHTYSNFANLQVSNLIHTDRTSNIYGLIFLTIIFACEIMIRTSPPSFLESCAKVGYLIFYAMLFNRIYGLFKGIWYFLFCYSRFIDIAAVYTTYFWDHLELEVYQ